MYRFWTSARALSALAILAVCPISMAAEHSNVFEPPAADASVGVVGTTAVKYKDLPQALQQSLKENEERYQRRRASLDFEYLRAQHAMIDSYANQVLDQKATELEARAQGTTADKVLASIAVPAPNEQEIQAFYDQHRGDLKRPLTEVHDQIADFLKGQSNQAATRKTLDALRAKYAVRLTLDPLRQSVAAVGPTRGPADAAVTIVEFADFQCPYCGRMAPVLKQLLDRYPRQIRLVYREYPLNDIHPAAMNAAVAGVCADQQGKFWELHDALFADQSALDQQALIKTAERLGIKLQPFASCMLSSKAFDTVHQDMKAGDEAGVTGTPGLFIDGRFYDGYMPLETIAALIEDELQRRGGAATRADATDAIHRQEFVSASSQ